MVHILESSFRNIRLSKLCLWPKKIPIVFCQQTLLQSSQFQKHHLKYQTKNDIFSGLGCLKALNMPARRVPYAIKDWMKLEIDNMVDQA
jgi:hypothetical protein